MTTLNNLNKTHTRKSKRLGRGIGSGKGGHTVGRGQKGQKSRSGYKVPRLGFEGGQMPLSRRLPKLKGFSRGYYDAKKKNKTISLTDLNQFNEGDTVTIESMIKIGLVKDASVQVKILANGEMAKKLHIENLPLSKSAQAKIEAAGGTVKVS